MVVLPQEPSDLELNASEVLGINVEVADARKVLSMYHLQVHSPETHPCSFLLTSNIIGMELKDAIMPAVYPSPRDVDVLEIHVSTLRAQALHLCLNAKQDVRGICASRNVEKDMPASPHQVEPLAVDVLQVRIPLCGCGGATVGRLDGL